MEFLKKYILSAIQGGFNASAVGITYKTFVDPEWDLKNIPNLVFFWSGFMVPLGISWSILNQFMLKKFRINNDIIGNLVTLNKKYFVIDVVFNQILFQSIFVYTFYNYLDYSSKKIELAPLDKNTLQKSELHNEPFNDMNLFTLIKTRIKLALLSYSIDMCVPLLMKTYYPNKKWKYNKDLLINVFWHVYVLTRYYYPVTIENIIKSDDKKNNETHQPIINKIIEQK